MRGLLHDLGARVVVLVDAVAEAHQAEGIVLVLGAGDEFGDVVDMADLAQHVERRLVGATMCRSPQASDAGRDAGERIGTRRTGKAHRRGRRVLLMVGMQDEDALHRARQHGIDLVFLARHGEAHVQEVGGEAEIVLGVNEWLADMILVGHRSDRRHLGDQPDRGDHTLVGIGDIGRVVIEGRQRADDAAHHRHRVRVAAEAAEELRHLLVHHRMTGHAIVEILLLRLGRQFAVKQQVADFQKIAVLGQLVDRITAMEQDAGIAVDIGDGGFAARGGGEAGIIGEGAGILVKGTDVDHIWTNRPASDCEVMRLAGHFDRRRRFFGFRIEIDFFRCFRHGDFLFP